MLSFFNLNKADLGRSHSPDLFRPVWESNTFGKYYRIDAPVLKGQFLYFVYYTNEHVKDMFFRYLDPYLTC